MILARNLFVGMKQPAESWPHVQHRKKRRRDADAANGFSSGAGAPFLRDGVVPIAPRDDAVESTNLRPPVEKLPRGRIHVEGNLRGMSLDELNKPVHMLKAGLTQQESID